MDAKKKIKTEWNLGLIYKGLGDARIARDVERFKQSVLEFEKKYRTTPFTKTVSRLARALKAYEKLCFELDGKPSLYFAYRLALKSDEAQSEARSAKLSQELTPYGNRLTFFRLAIGAIPARDQKRFLADPRLSRYRHLLRESFRWGKHQLTEKEENIASLYRLPAASLWEQGVGKLVEGQTVKLGGKRVPLSEAQAKFWDLPTAKRRALWADICDTLKENVGAFAESELNALVIGKKVSDDLRGFKEPFSATILSHENDEASVLALTAAVSKRFSTAHRFYALKKKVTGLSRMTYADRNAPIGKISRAFSFDESVKILRKSFGGVGSRYSGILDRMLAKGQIDVFPRRGKNGGAFCSHGPTTPTLVLLNHASNLRSLTTFAHEMGHAIHAELARAQPIMYRDYSTAVAETASNFFELVVFKDILATLPERERVIALHEKVQDDVSSIFRQVAAFNFEVALHRAVREKGFLQKEEIGKLLNEHMASYLGPAVSMHERDGYMFIIWSHFRSFFYVYTYAFGNLIARSLYEAYKKDARFEKSVRAFLAAGGSERPTEVFKGIGIDITKPDFFASGLDGLAEDISALESLTRKRRKSR